MIDTTRRRLIAVGGAVGLSALAGCPDAGPLGEGRDGGPDEGDESADDETPGSEADQGVDHEDTQGSIEIVEPQDGDSVESPFEVRMEVEGFELVPVSEETGAPETDAAGDGNDTGGGNDTDGGNETGGGNETSDGNETGGADDQEAGAIADGTGHLHVIVDWGPVEPGDEIPDGAGFIHLGDGQTETEVDLSEGEYDLVAQASDSTHIAFDLLDEISITVESASGDGEDDPEGGTPFPGEDGGDAGNETDGGGGNETDDGAANETGDGANNETDEDG